MTLVLLYWFALAASSFVAAWAGDRHEKICIALYGAGSIITAYFVSPLATRFRGLEWSVLAVDVALLVPFIMIVVRSTRHWPLWMTAFQVVGIVTNTVVLSQVSRRAYAETISVLAYGILVTIVVGSLRSRQQHEEELEESRRRRP